ncbi:hypothetical protein BC781_103100 [Sediminitomix flava]|uniref:Uncharacterized protein n=1 Tax=Sediminitomix flava TaxID=379075 RepID=A0A315Z8Y7_SEDFL|nr:hypothetical protein BC781_103100 [Sediminitomix flava]
MICSYIFSVKSTVVYIESMSFFMLGVLDFSFLGITTAKNYWSKMRL